MKLRKLALSLLTGLAVGSSLLGAGQVLAQDTVKIGGNFELTGDAAAYGTPMSEAAKLAVKEVNENGGVLGGKVEYVEYDNTSDLTEAASVAQRLASEDVVGIVGPATTGDSNAQIPVIQEAAVPAILPAATGNGMTLDDNGDVYEYLFRVAFEDAFQGRAAAKYVTETLGAQTAALFVDQSTDYATGLEQAFTEEFEALGGQVVTTESFQSGDTDFTASLTSLLSQEFDVLYVPGYYTEVGLLIKQARELGITQPIVGGDGLGNQTLVDLAGASNVNDVYYTAHYSPLSDDEDLQDFLTKFEEEYGKQADQFAVLSYDATMLLLDALERAGSADRQAVTDALAATETFKGLTGTFSIDEDHNPVKEVLMLQLTNGEVANVEAVNVGE
ncbi:ABC transporter substrate-binding protein [Aerococcaceae bacterium INB8]|uniref:ABC transporter substrate-binding protein n=1 Tax=Ruoffia halotolerans TaxID=2748684 RepID=A0A839A753_9LACT|nr:ABC transporter substrate-binding protein [Ruoffia halotolerans]MBA5729887.1 ABC transporter substrate-binding protein [Ruoffia halotolerans]